MFLFAVIEHLNIIDYVGFRFLTGHIMAQIRAFAFQAAKESVGYRIAKRSPLRLMLHRMP